MPSQALQMQTPFQRGSELGSTNHCPYEHKKIIISKSTGMTMKEGWHKERGSSILKMGKNLLCNPWKKLIESQTWDC